MRSKPYLSETNSVLLDNYSANHATLTNNRQQNIFLLAAILITRQAPFYMATRKILCKFQNETRLISIHTIVENSLKLVKER